jgi:hypothetical protein
VSKSALVKIGVPPEQAESMKLQRHIRQLLEHQDASIARLRAATNERIRELVNAPESDAPADEEPAAATA